MRKLGATVPNFVMYFIPLVNIYWYWVYAVAAEKITKGKLSSVLTFVLIFLIGIPIAPILIQYYFNQVEAKKKTVKTKKRISKKA
jgi:energy-coupling factor transporter transmembrane protein EcfT